MPRTTTWRAIVTYPLPQAELTDDVVDALMGSLPGFGTAQAIQGDQPELQLQMTVEAGTLRQAVDAALPPARAAHTAAYGTPGEPVAVQVLTDEDYQREIARPRTLDLVGTTGVGQILGVSRQRAAELADKHPDFPAPIGHGDRGPVWTRDSVEAFSSRWVRTTGRPKKTQQEE